MNSFGLPVLLNVVSGGMLLYVIVGIAVINSIVSDIA